MQKKDHHERVLSADVLGQLDAAVPPGARVDDVHVLRGTGGHDLAAALVAAGTHRVEFVGEWRELRDAAGRLLGRIRPRRLVPVLD